MLEIAGAKPSDYVIDLGSGNSVTVVAAAKRGIRALGVESDPDMVELSRRDAAKEKDAVSDRRRSCGATSSRPISPRPPY